MWPAREQLSVVDQERELRTKVNAIIGAEKIKAYGSIDLSYTFRDAIFIYVMLGTTIGVACYLHLTLGPLALIAAPLLAIVSGIAFNWINVQIHEASHHLLLGGKKWNDVYCNLVIGSLALQDVETYRAIHGMHHAQLHTKADPDLGIYSFPPGSVRHLTFGISGDLSLKTAFRRKRAVTEFIAENRVPFTGAPLYTLFSKIVAQAFVLGLFLHWCGAWGIAYYATCYLYGLVGVYPVLIRIRTIVQHHDDKHDTPDAGGAIHFVSRSTVAPLLEFILVGARMDYHFEHHLYPKIPYYNLRKMHRTLSEAGLFELLQTATGHALHTDNYLQTYATMMTGG